MTQDELNVALDTLKRRDELVIRIGQMWRSDWSGHIFDGRDGLRWLQVAVCGTPADLDSLDAELTRIEEAY